MIAFHFSYIAESFSWSRIFYALALFVAVFARHKELIPILIVLILTFSTNFYFPPALLSLPSLYLLIPFVIMVLLIYPFKPMRAELNWFRLGRLDEPTWLLIVLTGL